jgi:alpha-tubulin suppressor-like RCC1 family protein
MKMTGFNFKNKGKAFIFWAVVISLSSLFIFRCGQAPQDETQSSLLDKQSSIITADHNRRIFFNSSHDQIKFGYAVQSCFVKLGGNFLVDGYNSFCGEYNQNQNISTGSVAYVNEIKINGRNVRITGQVVQVQSCDIDVSQIIDKARQNNNNSVIPSQFIRDGKLKLENNDSLTLPSGVYYFKEIKVSGRAVLEFLGPATVVVEGDVSVDGQGQIKTNPVFLRIISTGKVKVEGQGAIYAGVIGNEVKVDGKGQIFGGVISREFKGEGQGATHFDKGLGLDRVEVFPSEVTIKVGETAQLTAVAKDIFGNEISCVAFEWSSSDQSVAIVNQNGLVQGAGEGRAIISANAKKEGYSLLFKGEAIVNIISAAGFFGEVIFVFSGYEYNCAIKQDSSLWCWGWNVQGQLGDGTNTSKDTPVQIMSSGVVYVDGGGWHTCAIKQDKSLWCWGENSHGQLGDGTNVSKNIPVQILSSGVVHVSVGADYTAGNGHTCAIKEDGSLWCWGSNWAGQLGDGTNIDKNTPVQIMPSGVAYVSAGWSYTCAIKTDGSLWCWGAGSSNTPVQIMSSGVVSVSVGAGHVCTIKSDGSLWCWGYNRYGQLGDGTNTDREVPVQIMSSGVVSVSAGWGHTCAIKQDKSLWCWGNNWHGQIGDGTNISRNIPIQIMSTGVLSVSAGGFHTCAVKTDGSLWCWGTNWAGQLGVGNATYVWRRNMPIQIMQSEVVSVDTGSMYHTCAVKADGSLWCWGGNLYGEIGDGDAINVVKPSPVQIMPSGVVSVALGGYHTCAIKQDGSLWCWGWNSQGQLGDGTDIDKNTPVQIMPSNVMSISLGWFHTCAIKQDRSLWCWGDNTWGQLGIPGIGHTSTPIQVMTDVASVSLGDTYTCAIKLDGSLWCWGENSQGQLGDGTNINRDTPVQIIPSGVVAVSSGSNFTCAVKVDGSLWCWGSGVYNIPVQIEPSGVITVSVGGGHICAIKTDSSLWCVGWNEFGQLGDGTYETKFTPVQVIPSGVALVSAGFGHTCAIKNDGSLWCWGWNGWGQLGFGWVPYSSIPIRVIKP